MAIGTLMFLLGAFCMVVWCNRHRLDELISEWKHFGEEMGIKMTRPVPSYTDNDTDDVTSEGIDA